MAVKIVHGDDIAGRRRRYRHRFDVGAEDVTVDKFIEPPKHIGAVAPRRGD